ncbi:MAG: HlyD family efflux transporter periplasmic adaptor subunit [Bacteroidales bacterium]|nr:HlyD family efflux transporter periplasmic adaptor subunit [Bacteroidales bacterium]
MEELRKRIEDSDVKAPGKGVITWVNDKIGSTVSYGSEVVKLANLTSFKVEGTVSEIYLPKLSIGGKIVLNINDSILSGKISAINPTVQNESVKFTVMLDRKDHPVLRSNQRTDVNIVTSNRKNIIRIPREGLVLKGSNPYLFVVKDGWAYRRMVSFGESSFYYIEVKEGILPGEEVIISDMEENMHHEKIKLKK